MKRTITEILVEVEETVAVRTSEKHSPEEHETADEILICPHCGKAIHKSKDSENKENASE